MPADGMPVQWHASPMATPTTYQLFKGVKATIADTDKTSSKTMSLRLLQFVKGRATQFTANKIACAGVYVRTVEQVLPNSRTFSAAVSTFLFSTACIFLSRGEKKKRSHVAKRAICPAEKGRKSTWQSSDQTKCTLLWGLLNLPVCNMLRCFVQGCIWLLT